MIGDKLAERYEVLAELGQGGMGVVYLGRDEVLGREVAIKVIAAATGLSDAAEQRFRGEAQTIAQLDHPSIVSIFDFGIHDGRFFYVMPVIEGQSLRELIDRRTLSEHMVMEIGGGVAEALAYTHARGIVHRDIKPENIMVSLGDEGRPRVTLMDFGLARGLTDDPLTKTGLLIGTVTYLSPEQVAGRVADASSDLYALGTVLYEALAHQPPFVGETQAVLYRIVHEYPTPLRDRGVDVDQELEALILGCLAKEPGDRPPQAAVIARGLRQIRGRHLRSGGVDEVTMIASPLRRSTQAPLIGRGHELAELQQRLSRALAGEGNFIVLGGEVGAGKTRLIAELESLARARGAAVLHGNLAEQAGAFPYFGFCEVIVDFFRTRPSSSPDPLPDLSDLAPELVAIFPTLAEVEALRPKSGGEALPGAPVPSASRSITIDNRQQIFETLARALIRLAQATPLCLIFEDLHAADASIEVLHYIVSRLAATPALIVATYRTTEVDRAHPVTRLVDELRASRRFAHVVLGPLSRSEHRILLGTLLGEAPPESAAERLFEATEGNPLFTKELVRSLRSAGEAERADAWLMLSPGHLQGALPGTIQQAIDRRLSRLPADLREILACAAVLGRSFDSRELAHLTRDPDDLDDGLDRLIHEGILEEEASRGDRLAFVSGAAREVVYAQIPRRRRRGLHRRYAEHLEERYAGRLARVYTQLLHHYAEGDVPERSVHYGTLAARLSLESFSPEEAIRAARTAREFLDDEWEGDPGARADVHELLAAAFRLAGDLDSALRELEAAIADYQRRAAAVPLVRALLLASRTAWQARRTDDTRRLVELGLTAARGLSDEAVIAEALPPLLALAGTLASLRGEGELASEYLREADALTRPRADEGPAVETGGTLIVALASPAVASEPAAIQTQEDVEVLANVFETLLVADDDGHILPGLAERWEALADGRIFAFTLREGVRFHDGAPLSVAHVIASLTRLAQLRAGALPPVVAVIDGVDAFLSGVAPTIRGIRARGGPDLEIELSQPLAIFPALIATPAAAIARISDESASEGILAAGTGPFRLVRHGVRSTVIERSPDHWRAPALVDAIEFRFLESAAAMVAGLRARELDVMRALVPEDVEDESLAGLGGAAIEGPVKLTYFAIFNALAGPLTRAPEVRRALAHVVPVHDLVWQLLGRFAVAASGLTPPGILGYDPGRRRPRLSLEEARALLAEADVYAGATLRVLVFPVLVERYKPLLGALSEVWSALGLQVEIVRLDLATFIATGSIPAGIDVILLRWGADFDDPDDFTHGNFHSQSGRWRGCYADPAFDRLVERGRAESDLRVRERIYHEVEALLQREGVVLPLFHGVDHRIAGSEVRGMHLRAAPPFANYAELSKRSAPKRRPEAAAGAVIRVPMRGQVAALDPIRGGFAEVHEVLSCVFESLTRRVGGAQIVPWLAESLEAEGGGTLYRIRLRRDITFHDGRRLTARDVRYSFERMLLRADSTDRWLYAPIVGAQELLAGQASELSGLTILSDHELTIELVRPLVYFPGLLSHSVCAIIPEGADRRADLWQEHPAGTGPFRVQNFEPGRRLELGRAPGYWRPGIPRASALVFHFGAAPAEIRGGFEAGRYSLAGEMLPADVDVLRRDPNFASGYRETPSFATYFIALNTRRGPLADPILRRQIARAIDRPRLARLSIGRLARPAEGLIPPGLLGYEASREAEASAAVDTPQAGLRDLELRAIVHPVFHAEYRAYFRRLCDTLAVLGIKVRIVDEAQSLGDLPNPAATIDLDITRWFADYPDAHSFVGLLHTREGRVGALCGSERVDRLLGRGQTTLDPRGRHAIYRQIEEIIAQDVCLIPLFHPQTYRFARPEIEGLEVSHGGPMVAYEELAIRESGE